MRGSFLFGDGEPVGSLSSSLRDRGAKVKKNLTDAALAAAAEATFAAHWAMRP
jgi:hypothetical protein